MTEVRKVIFYFDGWKPVILHERKFIEDNLGSGCSAEDDRMCHREVVTWTFTDIDRDGVKDLVEL